MRPKFHQKRLSVFTQSPRRIILKRLEPIDQWTFPQVEKTILRVILNLILLDFCSVRHFSPGY